MIQTVNPATGIQLSTYQFLNHGELQKHLDVGHQAFGIWRKTPLQQRCQLLLRLAQELRKRETSLAQLMVNEMGKPISQAKAEVEKCAMACEYYAGTAENWFHDVPFNAQAPKAYAVYEPLGLILGIMPWNFPLWQVIRFALPTLLAGNTVAIKHAPNTLGSAQALKDVFKKADFPIGVYQDIPMAVEDVGHVIADDRTAGVSLTGSTRAGKSVGEKAGHALKRCVLELGGSDPYLILDDADLDHAAEQSVQARMLNGGQSCIAGKRIIVTQKNYATILENVIELMKKYPVSDPMNEACKLGPMAREDLRYALHTQVEKAKKEGASIKLGGEVPKGPGYFYPATVISDVDPNGVAFKEELFGPVAVVVCARNEEEAIRLANHSRYGLGAAIFTRNVPRAEAIAREQMAAGMVVINGVVRSDPRWPFGGIKDSGLGRELTQYGAHEFTSLKTIIV